MIIIESKTLELIEEILESNVKCKIHVDARELRDNILRSNNLANLEMVFIEPSYSYPGIFLGQMNYQFTSAEIDLIKKESIIDGEIHKNQFIRILRDIYNSNPSESIKVTNWLEEQKIVLFAINYVTLGEVDFPEWELTTESRDFNRGGDSFEPNVDMGGRVNADALREIIDEAIPPLQNFWNSAQNNIVE